MPTGEELPGVVYRLGQIAVGRPLMFEIRKEITFEAAHRIKGHKDPITGEPGKCSRRHGHSYTIALCFESPSISDKTGFVLDYYWIGTILKSFHDKWDHQNLNKFKDFRAPHKSTAERIAEVVYNEAFHYVVKNVPYDSLPEGLRLVYAECRETASTYARYYSDAYLKKESIKHESRSKKSDRGSS